MLLLSALVRKVVQSAVVCWSVKSHYTERQIGSISLPPYANPTQPSLLAASENLRNVENLAF